MNLFKHHKELIPLIAVGILLGFTAYDLFSQQQDNTKILKSGKTITPPSIRGRSACEVPIPDISKRSQPVSPAFKEKNPTSYSY